jgi:hypothetical protein
MADSHFNLSWRDGEEEERRGRGLGRGLGKVEKTLIMLHNTVHSTCTWLIEQVNQRPEKRNIIPRQSDESSQLPNKDDPSMYVSVTGEKFNITSATSKSITLPPYQFTKKILLTPYLLYDLSNFV